MEKQWHGWYSEMWSILMTLGRRIITKKCQITGPKGKLMFYIFLHTYQVVSIFGLYFRFLLITFVTLLWCIFNTPSQGNTHFLLAVNNWTMFSAASDSPCFFKIFKTDLPIIFYLLCQLRSCRSRTCFQQIPDLVDVLGFKYWTAMTGLITRGICTQLFTQRVTVAYDRVWSPKTAF